MIFWEAVFQNTIITQDPEFDFSDLDRSKSKFYDLIEFNKTEKLLYFNLHIGNTIYSVDLTNGRFSVGEKNSKPYHFYVEGSMAPENKKGPFELVWFIDVEQTWTLGQPPLTSKKYRLGYKTGNDVRVIVI